MKPWQLGKKVSHFHGKRDAHPKKGWHNWWEDLGEWLSRRNIKQRLMREIKERLEE
jgi:hypothetical protein